MAQQQPNATNPQAAHLQQPHATQLPLTPQQMRLQLFAPNEFCPKLPNFM